MAAGTLEDLDARILATLAYAGLFNAGLREPDLLQRLFGPGAAEADVLRSRLSAMNGSTGRLVRRGETYYLAGTRPGTAVAVAPDLGPVRAWAASASWLPWVRYVGLTGSLAKGAPDADMDVFVVAASERGYLAFALLKTVGRWLAARRGLRLCLNFLVEEHELLLRPHDAFTATEFVTMLPLLDEGVHLKLWASNAGWVQTLCGGARPPAAPPATGGWPRRLRRTCEGMLAGLPGAWLNALVRAGKRRRLARQAGERALSGPDVVIAPGYFKQHTANHRMDILGRFSDQLDHLGIRKDWLALPE